MNSSSWVSSSVIIFYGSFFDGTLRVITGKYKYLLSQKTRETNLQLLIGRIVLLRFSVTFCQLWHSLSPHFIDLPKSIDNASICVGFGYVGNDWWRGFTVSFFHFSIVIISWRVGSVGAANLGLRSSRRIRRIRQLHLV